MTLIDKFFFEKKRLIKFLVVGLGGTVVNLSIVWFGNTLFFQAFADVYKSGLSIGLAIAVSIFFNFLLNYFWTWKDRKQTGWWSFFIYLFKYYLISLVSAGLQFLIANGFVLFFRSAFFSMQNELPVIWKLAASFIGIALASIINFLVNHFWTFGISETKETG